MPAALDRQEARSLPLRCRNAPHSAQSNEAATDAERGSRLPGGDPKQLVDVELRSDARREPSDEPLALERIRERDIGTSAVEGERRLGRDRLEHGQLFARERT